MVACLAPLRPAVLNDAADRFGYDASEVGRRDWTILQGLTPFSRLAEPVGSYASRPGKPEHQSSRNALVRRNARSVSAVAHISARGHPISLAKSSDHVALVREADLHRYLGAGFAPQQMAPCMVQPHLR